MQDSLSNKRSVQSTKTNRQGRKPASSNNSDVSTLVLSPDEINVGLRLREIRTQQGLSIRALAARSKLNVNTLSLIENGKTSPSVSTLQQLAQSLRVPITAFFETVSPKNKVAHQKFNQHPKVAFPHGVLEDLGAGIANRMAEPFLVTLEPGAGSGLDPIVHTGCEFVYCVEGQLTYIVGEETFVLEPGDTLLFEAHQPHRWRNEGSVPSRSLLVMCPSDQQDNPTESHFLTDVVNQ